MKLAVCSGTYGMLPLDRIIQRIEEQGFSGVEISSQLHMIPDKTSQKERKNIRNKIEASNLDLCSIHHIYPSEIKLLSTDKNERKIAIDYTKTLIKLAVDIGCKIVVAGGGLSRKRPPDVSFDRAWNWLCEIFSHSADYAEKSGIIIAIEPLNRYETNMITNTQEGLKLIDHIGSPAIQIMYDTYQMNIEDASFRHSIKKARGKIAHVHVADNNRLAPGRGHIDFKEILHALNSIDYQGYISLETYCISPEQLYLPNYEDADAEVTQAKAFLSKIISELNIRS